MNQTLRTVGEVADLLRVNTDTIYRLIRNENLPAIKVGRQWRFVAADIQYWMQSRTQGVQPSSNEGTQHVVANQDQVGGFGPGTGLSQGSRLASRGDS